MDYPRRGRPAGRYLALARVGTDDETRLDPARGRLRGAAAAAPAAPQASAACDQMRAWLHAGRRQRQRPARGRRRKRQTSSAPAPPGRQRPLASNMKLFTTATALSRLGPEARIATKVLSDGAVDADGVLHGSLYLQGGGDPALGTPGLLRRLPRRPRHQPLRAEAADPRRRDHARSPAASTPTTRSSTACRGVADSGYATSSYIGPLSGLAFNSGFSRRQRAAASPPTRPSWRPRSWPRSLRAAGVAVPAQVALGDDAGRAPSGSRWSAPPP